MPAIRILSEQVANQIAAGEVVERPASVAKELLENALDAGARRVRIEVAGGGAQRLRVVDDGHGMAPEDARLALQRHATSKLRNAEDLVAVATLGFRGEALPSIAAVSRFTLETATAAGAGTRIRVAAGKVEAIEPAGLPAGTAVTVERLFYNLPARRKFLKTEATELGHIATLASHYALAHPELHLELHTPQREIFRLAPAASHRERLRQLFGVAAVESLIEVAAAVPLPLPASGGEPAALAVYGFVSPPEVQKLNRQSVFTFVNRRLVHDRVVQHALGEAYRHLLPNGVHPMVLLFLDLPFAEVDVNVHPAKVEVRFRRQEWVHDAVREAIRGALGRARPVPALPRQVTARPSAAAWADLAAFEQGRLEAASAAATAAGAEGEPRAAEPAGPAPSPASAAERSEDNPIARRWSELAPRFALTPPLPPPRPLPLPLSPAPESAAAPMAEGSACARRGGGGPDWLGSEPLATEGEEISRLEALGQIQASFIVAASPRGLWLVDQHAAHERVLFEQLLEQMRAAHSRAQPPPSQRLLLPAVLPLPPGQWVRFDQVAPELRAAGFEIEPFGRGTVAVQAAPAGLAADRVEAFWTELLETDEAEWRRASVERRQGRVAATLACHAAIKVNMPLEAEKMRWLLRQLAATRFPMTCPHGRPVLVHYSLREIQRAFKR
ncbi:MAG: DNA mismatch repair endonuclease MutL [Terriglobales bacterium]